MKTLTFLAIVLSIATSAFAQEAALAEAPAAKPKLVALESGTAVIGPANTTIGFVGVHEGDKPDPRKGGFGKFVGKVQVADGALKSVEFEIDTTSLFSEIPKLTGHLKSPDFFDVREHPKASFRSTSITALADDPSKVKVTGEFELLGTKKEIVIPSIVKMTPEGIMLQSKFEIDRTEFGMTYGEGKVKKEVAVSVVIGQPTMAPKK